VVGTANGEAWHPFYLLPSLGGSNTLRSYADYRFHDRHLALSTAEARVALFTHVDAAAFFDAGNVAAQFKDLNLEKTSIGIGLRLHSDRATLGRFDVAHGAEGWRFLVRMNDPLHLSRVGRRTAAAPFVP
jgi:outer membrane protein assembly factor BamA